MQNKTKRVIGKNSNSQTQFAQISTQPFEGLYNNIQQISVLNGNYVDKIVLV